MRIRQSLTWTQSVRVRHLGYKMNKKQLSLTPLYKAHIKKCMIPFKLKYFNLSYII